MRLDTIKNLSFGVGTWFYIIWYCNSFLAYFFLAVISAVQYHAHTMHLLCKMTLQKRYFQLHWIQISFLKDFMYFLKNISTKGRIRKKKRNTFHPRKKKVTIISFYLKCACGQIAFTSSYKWIHKDLLSILMGFLVL